MLQRTMSVEKMTGNNFIGNQWPLKQHFSKPQFKEDFVRKDDFVFSITAQITHKEIILPKLF